MHIVKIQIIGALNFGKLLSSQSGCLNSFLASGNFLLSADNLCKQFGPKSVSKLFDTLIVFLKELFEKVNFEKKSADDKHMKI